MDLYFLFSPERVMAATQVREPDQPATKMEHEHFDMPIASLPLSKVLVPGHELLSSMRSISD
jgi:hypothetical protein